MCLWETHRSPDSLDTTWPVLRPWTTQTSRFLTWASGCWGPWAHVAQALVSQAPRLGPPSRGLPDGPRVPGPRVPDHLGSCQYRASHALNGSPHGAPNETAPWVPNWLPRGAPKAPLASGAGGRWAARGRSLGGGRLVAPASMAPTTAPGRYKKIAHLRAWKNRLWQRGKPDIFSYTDQICS